MSSSPLPSNHPQQHSKKQSTSPPSPSHTHKIFKMCSAGYNTFACGCSRPREETRVLCEYARLAGRGCADFQTDKISSKSKTFDMTNCMEHS